MKIHPSDNVKIHENGHKYACRLIREGENVVKYGFPIGHATAEIHPGEWVHSHNLKTNLSGRLEDICYQPHFDVLPERMPEMFPGYQRSDGTVGIRNDIFIICTVGCIQRSAEKIAAATGAKTFAHPYGCSQLGDDLKITQLTLRGLALHPNAAGVLVLGLGCENNHIAAFQTILGDYDPERILFLNAQDTQDEVAEGIRLVRRLQKRAERETRVPVPISKLRVGLKCGGSDGFSGITANPLVGQLCDRLCAAGGACVLTEVPEMFGAETLLLERCADETIFQKALAMIKNYREYFLRHGQPVSENPSPGNKEGGITTLEEKSLGCVQKGGRAIISDVLDYGDTVRKTGLSLLNGPGNDLVAITNLMAAGVHLILFTTGRGTPAGTGVPTIKISSNSALAAKKENWIDFDAGRALFEKNLSQELFSYVLRVAGGEQTKNEQNQYEEIAIFKEGVTL